MYQSYIVVITYFWEKFASRKIIWFTLRGRLTREGGGGEKFTEYLKSVISREATCCLNPLLIPGEEGWERGRDFNSETISPAEGAAIHYLARVILFARADRCERHIRRNRRRKM